MSLLMEALKRAEQSKQRIDETLAQTPDPGTTLSLESPPPAPPLTGVGSYSNGEMPPALSAPPVSGQKTPSDPPYQRGIHAAPPEKLHSSPEKITAQQETAQNLFASKKTPRPSVAFWAVVLVLLLMTSAAAFHFWRQYALISSQTPIRNSPAPLARTPPPSMPRPPSAPPAARTEASQRPAPPPEVASHDAPTPLPPDRLSVSEPLPPRSANAAGRKDAPPAALPRLLKPTVSVPDEIVTGRGATIDRAYHLLQTGRFDEARQSYEQIVRHDPNNIDAVLGLATIAAKLGENERAYRYYQQAFEIDPKDPTALAGMINERGLPDPAISESRIKTQLASQPESPALLFSLGNLYAAQNRWGEAQKAYFGACSIVPDNADYLFNLAVSLDHLHQTNLALQYYHRALQTALENPRVFSFDVRQAKNRILELTPVPF